MEKLSLLIDDFLDMDPVIIEYIRQTFRLLASDYHTYDWVKHFDFADMFFSVFQDGLKANSEDEIDQIFSPAYYKVFYDEFMKKILMENADIVIQRNLVDINTFDTQVDELCRMAPSVAKLRPAICLAPNAKLLVDDYNLNVSISKYDNDYNEMLNLILFILTSCGGLARLFYTEKVSERIDDSGGFNRFISDAIKKGIEFEDGPDELFSTYKKFYYGVLNIDDDFLFRCTIVMYNNRHTLDGKRGAGKEIKTKKLLRDELNTVADKLESEIVSPSKMKSMILETFFCLNIRDPRILIYGIEYVSELINKSRKKWILK